jgi:hypothetical protein
MRAPGLLNRDLEPEMSAPHNLEMKMNNAR